jgi:hypothetical protein
MIIFMGPELGKWIFIFGLVLVIVGAGFYFFHQRLEDSYSQGVFSWIGRLPGDVRIEREGFKFYFPFTTLLLLNGFIWVVMRLVKGFQK